MDSNRLIEFLNKFLSEQKNKLIILDNASSHKNKQVQNAITKNNSLLYSVPYQHGTQAIEGFFNVLKSSDLSYNNLCLNIKNVISEIPKSFYLNLIKGTYKKKFCKADYFVKLYCFTKKFKFYYGFSKVGVWNKKCPNNIIIIIKYNWVLNYLN